MHSHLCYNLHIYVYVHYIYIYVYVCMIVPEKVSLTYTSNLTSFEMFVLTYVVFKHTTYVQTDLLASFLLGPLESDFFSLVCCTTNIITLRYVHTYICNMYGSHILYICITEIQWNLSIMDTLGPGKVSKIIKVS